jgi:hypothetical protein
MTRPVGRSAALGPRYLRGRVFSRQKIVIEISFTPVATVVQKGGHRMAVPLKSLTPDEWKKVKKDAGIKKTKWYVAGSVSVGSKIEALNKARAEYKSAKSLKSIMKYFKTLEDFAKALNKFAAEKDFKKDVDGALATAIVGWRKEAAEKSISLAKKVKEQETVLRGNDVTQMGKTFDQFIL